MTERGVSLTPDGDSNQQPVLRHAVVVPAHSFHQVSAWLGAVPPINAMAEKPESLWLTALLLRVPEAFGATALDIEVDSSTYYKAVRRV